MFPSTGKSGFVTEAAVRKLINQLANGEKASIHGFRTSLRSWVAAETVFSFELGEMALSHKVGSKVVHAYQRSDMLERRFTLMNAWADYCNGIKHDGLIGVADNVVAFQAI